MEQSYNLYSLLVLIIEHPGCSFATVDINEISSSDSVFLKVR